ncbi:MAG: hypothetical protein DRQ78_02440 [Epsilonproteobacteria bacterium]|nr:MAG: hypothetical protein DRQ78_02440 [Campylobacterota bacterium]
MEDFEYVGFWTRFLVMLFDVLLLSLILYPVLYLLYGNMLFEKNSEITLLNIVINYILPFMATLVFWHYKSATPGKMIIKAKIVDATSYAKPSTKQFIIRNIGYLISALPLGLGYFWIAWDKKKQGWHDKLAHTVVIKPKSTKKSMGLLGYFLVGTSILFAGIFIFFLTFGFMIKGGYMPDGNIYSAQRLKDSVKQELYSKKILKNKEDLRYYQPKNMLSFSNAGVWITKEGIGNFSTTEEGKILKHYVAFKNGENLDIVLHDKVLNVALVEIYMRGKKHFTSFVAVVAMPKTEYKKFKKTFTTLWDNEQKSSKE